MKKSSWILVSLAFLFALSLYLVRDLISIPEGTLPKNKGTLEELRDNNRKLQEQIERVQEEIQLYTKALQDEELGEKVLKKELQNYKMQAGLLDVQGEGVVILMADSVRNLGEHQNINEYLVHDMDVYQMISDLRNAGAEAISVNDERFLFHHSKVICNGPTIRVNGHVFSQPFIIKAIGPRKALQAAINVQGSYADSLRQKGIQIEANTSVLIEIPAYGGSYAIKYLERKKE